MENKIIEVIKDNVQLLPISSFFWEIEKSEETFLEITIDKYNTSHYIINNFHKPISLFLNLSKYGR